MSNNMRHYFISGLLPLMVLTGCTGCRDRVEIVDQTYVHSYGVEVPPGYWNSCGRDGAVVTTTADGMKVSKSYAAGVLEGETTYSYPHTDTVQKKHVYNSGKIIKETDYYYDGTPKLEVANDSSTNIREVTFWYTTGSPKFREKYEGNRLLSGEYYNFSNQKEAAVDNFEGTRINRDDYGQLISKDTVQDGQRVLETTYHSNGAPKEMIPYQGGIVHGTKKTFHPGGEPNMVEEWFEGIQTGTTTVYLNGERYAEVPYLNGNKNGIEKHYKEGTLVVEEIGWRHGKLHGPTHTYVADTVKTEWYYDGEPTSKANYERLSSRTK